MSDPQKAAWHMGYLQAISDLIDITKATPLLNREHLIKLLNAEVLRMKKDGPISS